MTINDVVRIVADEYEVSIDDILSRRRTAGIAYPRQVVMYLSWCFLPVTLQGIGNILRRSPATVSYAFQKVACQKEQDNRLYKTAALIKEVLK